MFSYFNLQEFIPQSLRCLGIMRESIDFFKEHKLWKGIFEHKWITLFTVVLSVLFTYFFISDLYSFFFPESVPDVLVTADNSNDAIKEATKQSNKKTAIFGGSKFLLLIMLEIVIFYFSVRTLEVLNNEKYKTTFGMFVKAEIRMIKVLVRSFIQALIVQVVLYIAIGLIGFDFLRTPLMFIVHGYFIGNALFDNYNEQQKLNIKESDLIIRQHSGAATTLGVIASVALMIPLIGPIITPIFGALTANIYGHRHNIHETASENNTSGNSRVKEEVFV